MKVSIIVPVYNCRDYIKQCVESVLLQTYDNWELLIIDDGSTDGTADICKVYSNLDERVKYFFQLNQGQGIARGKGLQEAKGEYIAFLDADDWLDPNMLQEVQQFASNNRADMVIFDYYVINDKDLMINRIEKMAILLQTITNAEEHPELFYTLKGAIWDKFYHKSLWEGIKQPSHPYGDTAVLPMVLAKARRVGQIHKPLYYYREGRSDSTVNRTDTVFYMLDSMKEIKNHFTRLKQFETYQESLRKYSEWMHLVMKNHVQRVCESDGSEDQYRELFKSCESFLEEAYPLHKRLYQLNHLVWGSYNLRCMNNRVYRNHKGPKYHYSFSSIISLMAARGKPINAVHSNPYRSQMLQADIKRELCCLTEEEYNSINYVCIDFLEERYPIALFQKQLVTLSDALTETGVLGRQIADPFSDEFVTMWRASALKLISFLKKRWRPEQIILVKNYLCEGFGRYGMEQLFPEVDLIRRQNRLLEEYYHFFEDHYNGIKVITNDRTDLEFTDSQHPHGCYPWHQNEILYYAIADKMEAYVVENIRRKEM